MEVPKKIIEKSRQFAEAALAKYHGDLGGVGGLDEWVSHDRYCLAKSLVFWDPHLSPDEKEHLWSLVKKDVVAPSLEGVSDSIITSGEAGCI